MTDRQTIFALGFLILIIGAAGFAWNGFLMSNQCNYFHAKIERLMDDQSDTLITYAFFAHPNLTAERKQAFEMIIDSREIPIKKRIEHFKEICRSGTQKIQLKTLLHAFNMYAVTKQAIFKADQRSISRWIQETYPAEDDSVEL